LNEDRARANMPPATQTDVDKAVSHGFDKKQSFRHRTKEKK
jgi:hypothetical protein